MEKKIKIVGEILIAFKKLSLNLKTEEDKDNVSYNFLKEKAENEVLNATLNGIIDILEIRELINEKLEEDKNEKLEEESGKLEEEESEKLEGKETIEKNIEIVE